jgi:hypothetical protein
MKAGTLFEQLCALIPDFWYEQSRVFYNGRVFTVDDFLSKSKLLNHKPKITSFIGAKGVYTNLVVSIPSNRVWEIRFHIQVAKKFKRVTLVTAYTDWSVEKYWGRVC